MQEDHTKADFPGEVHGQPEHLQTSMPTHSEMTGHEASSFTEMTNSPSPSSQNYQHQVSSGGYPHPQQMSPSMYQPTMTDYSSFRSMTGEMDSIASTHSTDFNQYNTMSGGSQLEYPGDANAYSYHQSHSNGPYPPQQQLYYNAPLHTLSAIQPAYTSRPHASSPVFNPTYQSHFNIPYSNIHQQGSGILGSNFYHGQQPPWTSTSPQTSQQHFQHQQQHHGLQPDFSSGQQPNQYWRSNYRPYQQPSMTGATFALRPAPNSSRSKNDMSASLPNRPGFSVYSSNRSGVGVEEAFDRNVDIHDRRGEISSIDPEAKIPGKGLRQHYHPQQGPRSEYVLWCGNVPSDASVEELWNFFSNLPPDTSNDEPSRTVKGEGEERNKGQSEVSTENLESETGPESSGDIALSPSSGHGVLSVFIIARSNCAFVNYATNRHLQRAVSYFHGQSLRPIDPRCPRLVCRVRKKDDEAQAGVAGQRGRGIHVAWVKEQERKKKSEASAPYAEEGGPNSVTIASLQIDNPIEAALPLPVPSPDPASISLGGSISQQRDPSAAISALTALHSDEKRHSVSTGENSSGSLSFTSTNSSLFRHPAFHERFFILKSLGTEDLDRSVETGLWATQPHNEQVLDQAFRNSQSVYLVFSANQSGSFYGYARMTGSIFSTREVTQQRQGEGGTILHPLTTSSIPAPQNTRRTSTLRPGVIAEGEEKEDETSATTRTDQFLTASGEGEMATTSPLQLTPAGEIESPIAKMTLSQENQSWPVQKQRKVQIQGDASSSSLNLPLKSPLDKNDTLGPSDSASIDSKAHQHLATRALIHNLRLEERESQIQADQLEKQMNNDQASSEQMQPDASNRTSTPRANSSDSWGRPFKVEWIKTTPVSFNQVRKLRNPWRDNRQVKVSRDGTELEPNVGRLLLQEWEQPNEVEVSAMAGGVTSSSNVGDGEEEEA